MKKMKKNEENEKMKKRGKLQFFIFLKIAIFLELFFYHCLSCFFHFIILSVFIMFYHFSSIPPLEANILKT